MLDHYLPQSSFPELAYCWENLIPSCEDCNSPRHKGSWSPPRLARGSVKDARAFPTEEGGRALVRVLADQEDRLVHPGLEDPAHHLSFSFRCSRGLSGETL